MMVFVDTKIVSTRGKVVSAGPSSAYDDGVAFRLRGELGCQGIDPFGVVTNARENLFRFLQIANDFDTSQSSEFAFETAR